MSGFRVVIPARFASERLPGKPLADLAGVPMVVRCAELAQMAGADEVLVAADDARIVEAVEAAGARALMTDPAHQSGTDRIAEVARQCGWGGDEVVVNLQGDEPQMPPALIGDLARALSERPGAGVATMATPIDRADDLFSESIVKTVLDQDGYALYFSRAPIPWVRGVYAAERRLPADVTALRHLGLYAYRVRTLEALTSAPRAECERLESLEQLRALHLGIRIHVTVVDRAPPHGVDTPADLERVRRAFIEGA